MGAHDRRAGALRPPFIRTFELGVSELDFTVSFALFYSQELAATLLDGLHEDLNRVSQKAVSCREGTGGLAASCQCV